MKRLVIAGAAFALMTGWAAAQTPDPDAPPPPPMQNGAGPGPDGGAQADGPGGPRFGGPPRGWGHGMAGPGGGPDGMRGPPPWLRHGQGMMPPPSRGAVFSFKRGHGRGAITIRCAEDDTTRDCAEAVMPLLQMLMPNRGMGEHGDAAGQAPAQ